MGNLYLTLTVYVSPSFGRRYQGIVDEAPVSRRSMQPWRDWDVPADAVTLLHRRHGIAIQSGSENASGDGRNREIYIRESFKDSKGRMRGGVFTSGLSWVQNREDPLQSNLLVRNVVHDREGVVRDFLTSWIPCSIHDSTIS